MQPITFGKAVIRNPESSAQNLPEADYHFLQGTVLKLSQEVPLTLLDSMGQDLFIEIKKNQNIVVGLENKDKDKQTSFSLPPTERHMDPNEDITTNVKTTVKLFLEEIATRLVLKS